jgi:TonB-dependent receptor
MEQRLLPVVRKCSILLLITNLLLLTSVTGVLAARKNDGPRFPRENLIQRIRKIEQLKNVKISFDEFMVQDVAVPAIEADKKATIETLLKQTLHSSNLDYKKYSDNNYSIVRKQQGGSPVPDDPDKARERGSVFGMVLDEIGEPLVGATIMIAGTSLGTVTDMNGQYTLKQVPAGLYVIEARFISYQTQQVSDVQIIGGKNTRLDLVMKPVTEELSEVVVKAGYKQASAEGLYARQKSAVKMVDGISADLIKKTSDNNVAQVLKRVSGVTINKGKYVTVRGMSERYNNVSLNGTSLPSTEPNRRNFSFDVIPNALVDNVVVAKTFTPDMPGEFVGGTVQINTLSLPDEPFLKLSAGTGMNTISTGENFWSNKRFNSDYFLGNKRDWYGKDWKLNEYNQYIKDLTIVTDWDGVNAMNAKIPNYWGLQKFTGAPTQSYSLSAGKPFSLGGGNQLGVVLALTYRHEEKTEELKEENYRIQGEYMLPNGGGRYKFITSTGAVANIGWQMPGQKITWRNLFNNRFNHTNLQRISYTNEQGRYILEQYSAPLNNRLWQTQLNGEHSLISRKLTLNWMADYSKVNRDSPEDRLVKGSILNKVVDGIPQIGENGQYMVNWSWGLNGEAANFNKGHIMNSQMEETKTNVGADLEYAFNLGGTRHKLKTGYRGTFRESDYEQQYLRPQIENNDDIEGLSIQKFFAPENFANGYLYYIPFGLKGQLKDAYSGEQDLHAGYIMAELKPLKKLSLTGGVRLEDSEMKVRTLYYDKNLGTTDTLVVNDHTDWLPAITAIYNLTGNLNIRAAYSKTLARPDFRELTHTKYYNVDDRVTYISYEAVKQSTTDNADLRLEWYPAAGEVISVSAFYKKFHNPVELIGRIDSDLKNYQMLYANLDESEAKGLELNLRKSLGFVAPGSFLQNLYLSANATVLEANVEYNYEFLTRFLQYKEGEEEPEPDRDRPLQGLSPYSVNAGIDYDGRIVGVTANYSRTGRRLVTGGEAEKWDEYENARDVLDLQLSVRLLKQRFEIKANASDLLNQAVIIYRNGQRVDNNFEDRTDDMDYNEGDYILRKFKKGTSYSLSLSYSF